MKYRRAIEMYASTELSGREICRICKVTEAGFRCYLTKYHCELVLARYAILCSKEEAGHIKLGQLRGQLPATRAKYKDAIEACGSMEHIEFNVSQIARKFGLEGTNLGRQLRTHYPEIIEWREKIREWLGIGDGLLRGTRRSCKEQYAEAIRRLKESGLPIARVAAEFGLQPEGFHSYLKEHDYPAGIAACGAYAQQTTQRTDFPHERLRGGEQRFECFLFYDNYFHVLRFLRFATNLLDLSVLTYCSGLRGSLWRPFGTIWRCAGRILKPLLPKIACMLPVFILSCRE